MKSSCLTLTELPSASSIGHSQRPARIPRCNLIHFLILLLLLCHGAASASTVPAGFVDSDVSGYSTEIAGIIFDGTGRMFAWERTGRIWIYENDVKLPTPLLDIHDEVGGWDDLGLIGVVLHPNFLQNGYIYLCYDVDHYYLANRSKPTYDPTKDEYNQASMVRLTRYTVRTSDYHSVDPASRTILIGETISTGIPITFNTHMGGALAFGADTTLLVSSGDGAHISDGGSNPVTYYQQAINEGIMPANQNVGAFRSQMASSLNGKILRLDPLTGNGVPSNPWYDPANPRSAQSRTWSYGFRNPFRINLRPGTGTHLASDGNPGVLYVGDVGYDTWEELSVVTGPRQNFGWPVFEGLELGPLYLDRNPANPDAPNPLFGMAGCTQQYFTFRDLIVQATLATPSWPNPCNPAQQVPSSIPHFMHTRPVMDWKHSTGPSRTGIYSGNNAGVINIGAAGSPVSGPQFPGNCSIGGTWYQGNNFPANYKNTYFHGDLGAQWIHNVTFDINDNPVSVRTFADTVGGVVCIAEHPINGTLYYVDFYSGIRKISYVGTGNQPPTAVATCNVNYGPTPLAVQFNGSASTDPENLRLLYSWNFGDGSAVSTGANPSHTFTAPAGVPTLYVVTLTVTDTGGLTSQASLNISLNNTPPAVTITSPPAGTLYPMSGDTLYNLTANVTDAEQPDSQLLYQWQKILHHNNHEHPNPVDTNHVTTTVLSPIGCDGNLYYYRIILTVTDPAGLSGQAEVDIYPDCTNTPPTISNIADQSINMNGSAGPLGFVVGDLETAASNLVVTGSSSNPALLPNSNILFGASGSNRTVIVTPALNQFGGATVTVTVSDGSLTASDQFLLTVNSAANSPPSISDIPDQTTAEDTSTAAVSFVIADAETAASSLVVRGSSSNPTLVPNSSIVFGGSGGNKTVTVLPATNQSGSATITVTVSDGLATASDNFVLTVTPVNDAPTISNIPDITINQNTSTGPISFTVGDVDTALSSLVLSATSSNPTLVPVGSIVFGGSGANRTVTVTPAAGQSGAATITVAVSDGSLTATDPMVLTVLIPPAYVFTEGFEGTGFENTGWIKHGTPNPDYTNVVLHGAQSLNCAGAQYVERPFVFTNSFYLYFRARWNTWGDYNNVIYWDDPSWNIVAGLYADHNRLELNHGTANAFGTTAIGANTTYHLWVEWTKGTGTNGTMKLFTATTGVKPANPDASLSNGKGGATQRIYIGPTSAGPNGIFDRILVATSPIGDVLDGASTNTAPSISDILDRSVAEDTSTGLINFIVGDAETAASSLVVTASSSNPALVPNNSIVLGGSGANRTVSILPATNQSGSATITVTVSDGSLTASDTFLLSVTPVNDPPTISDIVDQTTLEDTTAGPIGFAVGDVDTALSSLVLSGSSSNPTLVPNSNITFGGSGANRTITVLPATNQSGSATITVTVSDGALTASDTFVLTVTAVNDPPTISDIPDQTILQGGSAGPTSFTIADVETAASSLVLSGSSSNPTLVPNSSIVFGGSSANRTISVTPAANQFGSATITATVSDGSLSASDTFLLTVTPASNSPPLISDIADLSTAEDTSTGPISFTIGDGETIASNLVVSGSSSDAILVPNANIVFGGSASNRTVSILPATNQSGSATITVTVSDGSLTASDSFVLTVTPVNDPPAISDIANRSTPEDTSTGPISFTVADVDTPVDSLVLSGSSSNPALVPNGNIAFGGSGGSRTVAVLPATNQSGSATITVTVSDGILTASDTFVLTVTAVNDPPTISDIVDQTTLEDTSTGPIGFTVGDVDTALSSLVLSGSSSNPTLVPNSSITFGGTGANRTVSILPATNQSGSTTITVTVSDGSLAVSDTFVLTVTAVNDPPSISNIPDTTINQDTSTGPISFTVGDVDTALAGLVLSATSSNPTLVPVSNIVFAGSGATRTVTITPVTNQIGTATITVSVSDGSLTATDPMVLTVNSAAAQTYLLSEGFEGTGFENTGWIKHGTPNADYTNVVLQGTQSLNCVGAQYVERPFVFTNSFNLYFRARWNTWTDYNNVIYWDDSNWNVVGELYAQDNLLELNHGSAHALGTTTIVANTTYHVWLEWTKGTGANGTMKLFMSTTGVKPATPEATIANGNGGATQRIYVGPTSTGPNVIFDRILVGNAPIGSNP